ncbi:MAG: site-2 protease family protein [Clostridia bacterium]|nr:site-2 protease family protein [Clostridia bacterium]
MNVIFTTVAAILIFAVLIFVHEFGHFIAAKLSGVKVNEFALGMGPKIFGVQKGETMYSLRLIPIGGFCAMEGEDEECDDPRAFNNKKSYVRLIILAAGAFMNILLGFILIFSLVVGQKTYVAPVVDSVVENSAAQISGINKDDVIISANGKRVHITEDLSWAISNNINEDKSLELKLKNGNDVRTVKIIPANADGKIVYGLKLKTNENNIFSSIRNSFYKTGFYSSVIIDSFVNLVRGRVPLTQISGPVGIVSEIGTVVEQTRTLGLEGFYNLLSLTILLTINLGVFNLFPLPALDGGRIFFVLIEMIRRKPIPASKEAFVHMAGFILLILLSIFVAFKDVFMLFGR